MLTELRERVDGAQRNNCYGEVSSPDNAIDSKNFRIQCYEDELHSYVKCIINYH